MSWKNILIEYLVIVTSYFDLVKVGHSNLLVISNCNEKEMIIVTRYNLSESKCFMSEVKSFNNLIIERILNSKSET